MNIQNLGPKEILGVKFKDVTCAELCLQLWIESEVLFLLLLRQDGFESNYQETQFQTITF